MLEKIHKENNINENDLWRKFLSGDLAIFDQIYEYWFPKLLTYGLQLTPDLDLVQDTVQQLFIDFWQRRKKLKNIEKFKNYLFKSFRNKLIKKLSSSKLVVSLDIKNMEIDEQLAEEPFESIMIQYQLDQQIQKKLKLAYQELTLRQKEAVYFRFYENMSYQEISETMNFKDAKYARTLIYRAIGKMKSALQKCSLV
jgi:RNA polymerase sigma-70 factor (ECF subfamily)